MVEKVVSFRRYAAEAALTVLVCWGLYYVSTGFVEWVFAFGDPHEHTSECPDVSQGVAAG